MTSPPRANDSFNDQHIVLEGHSNPVWAVAFSPSDSLLASGSDDRTVQLWNTMSGAHIATLNGHSSVVWSVMFSPDGTMLASGSGDKTIKLWDVGSRTQIASLEGHVELVYSVAFSPDGARLLSGSNDKTLRLWDVNSRNSISILQGHSDYVRCIAFSPDGNTIASGSADKTIRLWHTVSRVTVKILDGHSSVVKSVAFSPSGEHLASASADGSIRLWNVVTGTSIATIHQQSSTVQSIVFSPNGKHLISGSWDNTIQVWDVASRARISTLKGHLEDVECVAVSPDGGLIASGSDDTTVRIWRVSSNEVKSPPGTVHPSDLVGLKESVSNSQQNTLTTASASVPVHDDITESLSLYGNTGGSQQGTPTPTSGSVTLSNDITGSVSLESTTLFSYGGFGELFLGVHTGYGKVALKKPRRLLDEALIRRFLREVDLWCSVSHQYILPCLGMCRVGPDVYVVSPFIENGDLLSCMNRGKDLNRSKLLFEVAEALTHLHHRGIVHGDVKAQNILLADDGSALLCDFGLAKAFDTMATSTEVKGAGSVRWMAPELFHGEGRSMASDVYALGITIAEVLSGRAPYQDISDTLAVMFHVVYKDERPPKEPLSSPEGKSYGTLWETAEKCWVKDVNARPYMAQVLAMLFPLTRERA